MKTPCKTDLFDSISQILESKMNHTSDSPGRKISRLISYITDGKEKTLKYHQTKYEDDPSNFDYYYGVGFIGKLQNFFDVYDNMKEEDRDQALNHVMSSFPGDFNFNNYQKLKSENLLNLMSEFDSSFRGDIRKIHNVYSKWVIIETISDEGLKFYGMNSVSYVYNTFEEALFNEMNPNYGSAMNVLYKSK